MSLYGLAPNKNLIEVVPIILAENSKYPAGKCGKQTCNASGLTAKDLIDSALTADYSKVSITAPSFPKCISLPL